MPRDYRCTQEMYMVWQDYVMGAVQTVFVLGLIPSILHHEKAPFSTSSTTALGMAILAVTVATLELWFGATTSALISLEWFVLAVQRFHQCRRENIPLIEPPQWFQIHFLD